MPYGYYIRNEAYYAKLLPLEPNVTDEIMIGDYHPEGGCSGEFMIRFEELESKIVARLCMFDDCWHLFRSNRTWQKFMKELLEMDKPTIEKVIDLLKSLGFDDRTPRKNPNQQEELCPCCGRPKSTTVT